MRLATRFRLNQKKKLVEAGFDISNHKWVETLFVLFPWLISGVDMLSTCLCIEYVQNIHGRI